MSRFTSPENPKGKEYWEKLYKKAGELFGYSNITIPTLTRPWIVPDEIIVREAHDNAYIYKATLKVQLEQDHLKGSAIYNFDDHRLKELNDYSSQIIRELIIPELTKEINISKRYAPLRQVYYSLILAQWFKQKFSSKGGFYSGLIDRRNLNGITSKEDWSKTTYFKEYQKSFKDGEYNVKEPVYTPFGQTIRSYFSGGVDFGVGQQGQRSGAIANAIQKGLIRGNIAQETLAANSHIVAVDIGKGGGLENLGVDKRFIQLGKVSSPISADDKEYIENIEKMLVFSKRFGVGKARRYVQIMASGIRNVEVNGRLNENQLKRVLYLTSRSYELAARYLAGLIRRIKGSQPVWSLPLLENINLDLDEKVAKADYLFASLSDDIANGPKDMQELEDRVLLADRTQFNKHKWFRLDDNVTSWNKQDMKTPFIVADDETTSALESMIKQGFVVEDYFNSQPIYRQSDLLPDSEDIRFVCFLEDGFAIRKYISKRRSKLQEGKLETALDEFTITVEIKKRLGRQEIKMDEFLKPVLVDIAQPRAFINTGKETFMLTDFVEGTMMDDFLSGKTENERKPYITLFKKLFQKLFEEGIVWGSPYLRNIVISNEDGQVKLTLLDWENSLLPVGVVSDGLKRECMIQAWRKAAVLTAKERLSITSDYFSGPGTL
ncbi:MAG: hypothetical protein KKE64_08150, partial [Candidatus Omnitrophica bacterium]|nr:hypothetical protein [Candidatus Omnitrophota bacterium]